MKYTNILLRLVAFVIDFILYGIVVRQINIRFMPFIHPKSYTSENIESAVSFAWLNMAAVALFIFAYFALSEGILLRATIGKMIVRLRVANANGVKITFGVAILRSIFKMLPIISFMCLGIFIKSQAMRNNPGAYDMNLIQTIGSYLILAYAIISFGLIFWGKQQTLYDKVAKTFVIRADEAGLFQATIRKVDEWFKFLRKAGHSD